MLLKTWNSTVCSNVNLMKTQQGHEPLASHVDILSLVNSYEGLNGSFFFLELYCTIDKPDTSVTFISGAEKK